jgi:hypothetical protein
VRRMGCGMRKEYGALQARYIPPYASSLYP